MKQLERQLKALANGRRLAILKILKQRPGTSVGDIAEGIKLSMKATSKHLGILYAAELVEKEQKSLTVFYFLKKNLPTGITQIIAAL